MLIGGALGIKDHLTYVNDNIVTVSDRVNQLNAALNIRIKTVGIRCDELRGTNSKLANDNFNQEKLIVQLKKINEERFWENISLRSQIQSLETRNKILESKISKLESKIADLSVPPLPPGGPE